jgi:hypothetical protein
MKPSITSRELIEGMGLSVEEKPEIPLEFRPLLITSIVMFVPAKQLKKALNDSGQMVTFREVLDWQKATRTWLGLPPIGRGKPSQACRKAMHEWLKDQGNPSLEDIDAGWVPAHRRGDEHEIARRWSIEMEKKLAEFRAELAALNAAKDDQEVKMLLVQFLKPGKTFSFRVGNAPGTTG